jgi:type I restriction enzyme R subunit
VLAYFSGPGGWEADPQSEEKARRRQALYKLAGAYARAFASVAEDPAASGVNELQLAQYRSEVDRAISLRDAVRLHSGDAVDMKQFEPAMRHLIDTYIKADESEVISHLHDISLIDLVASKGAAVEEGLPSSLKSKRENVAEAIENNVRRLIIDETPVNPKFYEKMSELLTDLVKKRKDDALAYAEYLEKIAELIRAVKAGHGGEYPPTMTSPGRKALYDNLGRDESTTLAVDEAIRSTAQTGWRGNKMKERMLRRRLIEILDSDETVDNIIEIIRSQDEY